MATRSVPHLSLEAAQAASAGAQAKAQAMGIEVNIAVVDASLYLQQFARMRGAKLTSVDLAINKAFTAAGHGVPTATYSTGATQALYLPGGPGYGIHTSNRGRFTLIAGGVPIVVDGAVVGAIGVSAGTPAQDAEIARAGVEAVEAWVKARRAAKL